tara:strand:- start:2465 stop:3691 length:1227 start_codon:yes stop_codon:yes gene_type:complete
MLANLPRARSIMKEEGIDTIILANPLNVYYASDLASEFMLGRFEDYCSAVIISSDSNIPTSLIMPEFDLPFLVESGTWIENIYTYGNPWSSVGLFMGESLESNLNTSLQQKLKIIRNELSHKQEPSFIDAVVRCINENALSNSKVACDDLRLAKIIKDKGIVKENIADALQIMRRIRIVKTELELEIMLRGAEINAGAISAVIKSGKLGMPENNLTHIYRRYLVESEAKHLGDRGMMFGTGDGSNYSLPIKEDRVLEKGSAIVLDCLGTYNSYHMDLARTAVVGNASKEQLTRYNATIRALEEVEDSIKPGVNTEDLRRLVKSTIASYGLRAEFTSVTTHGLGLEVFEFPFSDSLQNGFKLEKGMVVNTEVFYRDIDYGGFHLEDSVLVTENGCSHLFKVSRDLVEFH